MVLPSANYMNRSIKLPFVSISGGRTIIFITAGGRGGSCQGRIFHGGCGPAVMCGTAAFGHVRRQGRRLNARRRMQHRPRQIARRRMRPPAWEDSEAPALSPVEDNTESTGLTRRRQTCRRRGVGVVDGIAAPTAPPWRPTAAARTPTLEIADTIFRGAKSADRCVPVLRSDKNPPEHCGKQSFMRSIRLDRESGPFMTDVDQKPHSWALGVKHGNDLAMRTDELDFDLPPDLIAQIPRRKIAPIPAFCITFAPTARSIIACSRTLWICSGPPTCSSSTIPR